MKKNVLITGADGFIGKNLSVTLKRRQDLDVSCFDVHDDPDTLADLLQRSDFVFHLAGINRPQHAEEFKTGNSGLTQRIVSLLLSQGRPVPVLITSSTQAALDNDYGISKREAEEAVFTYGCQSGAEMFVYRLPNVFGKWCRPNYNSAVATFCHNIAHDLPIRINDPSVMVNLVYIDDVVSEFCSALDGRPNRNARYCGVEPVHSVELGTVADLLRSFRASREEWSIPALSDPFIKKLYSTYLSYLPVDRFSYPLAMHVDERGSFTEFVKTPDRGQVSVNISRPGITKGLHWHHTKNEKFLVVSGKGLIRFRQVGGREIVEYPVSGDRLEVVDIPPGYTHDITNTGETDLVTVMWCNERFDPEKPDTFFEAVDCEG